MRKTVVIDVVGLTDGLIGDHTPCLARWLADGARCVPVQPPLPAVTCPVQATYLTGVLPERHGIVANGWYFQEECEIKFWRQSNRLVTHRKIWEAARALDPTFTCANLFWWYNMYSAADISVTPRPMYPADGRKLPDLYTHPPELRQTLQTELGTFPLFDFWGPKASIRSSQWIAQAALRVDQAFDPTLTLIYLPHLDYNLQRLGPHDPGIARDLRAIDGLCNELIGHYEGQGARVIVLSEYGITPVMWPVSLNRVLREAGLLAVREELGLELLDAGASRAFAVADHQIAHVHVRDPQDVPRVRGLLERQSGIERVLDRVAQSQAGLAHARSGDLVAIATPDAWFTYYYWLDDRKAPDFARTVDIHRKPGFDPVELFLDPAIRWPMLKIATRMAQKKLGMRYLMDVIPLDPNLVRGSHGRLPERAADAPVFISRQSDWLPGGPIPAVDVHDLILSHLLDQPVQDATG